MLNQKLMGAAAGAAPTYIEDVFSTWLYTGNGSTQTINNGIDLAGKGGLVWVKCRNDTFSHRLQDTVQGTVNRLNSASTSGSSNDGAISSVASNGFTIGSGDVAYNNSSTTYASWTFRKQPKFFDVVTYTGNGSANQAIPHNLGSTPGAVIIKSTAEAKNWAVWHRTQPFEIGKLNLTDAWTTFNYFITSAGISSTTFQVGGGNNSDANNLTNVNGQTYVAYLFAHNAGGFGLSGTDNVISCGSFTTDGSGAATVSLGYEPQYFLFKRTDSTSNWRVLDVMRGGSLTQSSPLIPNTSDVENSFGSFWSPTATGFNIINQAASSTWIYIAIRRGPMRTPTTGTSVFQPTVYTGTNVDNRLVNTEIVTDMAFVRQLNSTTSTGMRVADRLRGDPYLSTGATAAEVADPDSFMTPTLGVGNSFSAMNGFGVGNDDTAQVNRNTVSHVAEAFARAPGFFDVVCYTGTGSAQNVTHNLGVAPELMIVKERNGTNGWQVYLASLTNNDYLILNTTAGVPAPSTTRWNSTTPTSTAFSVGTHGATNGSGQNFVAYLFASCPGVSKVGSYTGNGSSQTINCGFTGGARFVMIKRTDSTGDWYVWDTARGIVANNDPHLSLNSTAAEVTTNDSVDPVASGFAVNQVAATNINVSGASYIYLAIA